MLIYIYETRKQYWKYLFAEATFCHLHFCSPCEQFCKCNVLKFRLQLYYILKQNFSKGGCICMKFPYTLSTFSVLLPIFSDLNSSPSRLHCCFSLILILIWRGGMKHMFPSWIFCGRIFICSLHSVPRDIKVPWRKRSSMRNYLAFLFSFSMLLT